MMVDGVRAVETFWERVWTPPQELDAIDELLVEDFVIENAGNEIRGRDAFREWVARFQDTIEDFGTWWRPFRTTTAPASPPFGR
jgi:hypothetical protein